MANAIQQAGGASEPSSFAPLHTNRLFTGLWTNRSPLSDAAVSSDMEKYGLGRQDSILDGANTELSSKLTLIRRPGTSVYNSQVFPPINRFYSFNTFTLTTETIHVIADTAATVYDATSNSSTPNTKTPIWQKSAAAVGQPTFFLGVGNVLYFTNGVENKLWNFNAGVVWNWGFAGPPNAPTVTQSLRPVVQPSWAPNMAFSIQGGILPIIDTNNNIQIFHGAPTLLLSGATPTPDGTTGNQQPNPWNATAGGSTTDGTITWINAGSADWVANHSYGPGTIIAALTNTTSGTVKMFFLNTMVGGQYNSGSAPPRWPSGVGSTIQDNQIVWQNLGPSITWDSLGPNTPITSFGDIIDPNGYGQRAIVPGKTGPLIPNNWQTPLGAITLDGSMQWKNTGPFAPAGQGPVQYGYAFKNALGDISNMSPASFPITVSLGNEVTVQGVGSTDPQVTTIYLYRIAQGGSTFLYLTEFANTGAAQWTFVDTLPDSSLNVAIQAQNAGQGTPLPAGATCLAYHLQRIFAAVGNVVYVSQGPDAIASTSSGNAGFNTTFTAQSKITRFWVSPLGLIVFTVRDSYIILGSGTDSDPLYMTTFVDRLPLLHYDAFTTHLTTPYMMLGYQMVVALDPSAGITEVSFPISDRIEAEMNPATAFVTYHAQASRENALYVSDGATEWYRMSATTAPETGLNWSPRAVLETPISAVQSVETLPGTYRLLIGPGAATGPILLRDLNARTDNGNAYPAWATFGSIVLAHPGELAGLTFITLESKSVGTKPALSVLLGEVSGIFESLSRTRQDPPNLPPSKTLYSDRYHFLQSQKPVWCRHFQMTITWPEEDAPNELYTFTIFGQTWSEYRSQ